MGACPSDRHLMRKQGGGGRIWHLAVAGPLGPAHSPLALSGSASPKLYSIWNSLLVSHWGRVISCVALPLKASSQGNQGAPVSHPSAPALIITFSPFLCSLNCVPTFLHLLAPRLCLRTPSPCVSPPPSLSPLQPAWAAAQPSCLAILPGSPSAALSWPHPLPPRPRLGLGLL